MSGGSVWAVCVNEWDGASYHELIVGPFDSEEQAEAWASDCPDPTSVFDLMPPSDWKRLALPAVPTMDLLVHDPTVSP